MSGGGPPAPVAPRQGDLRAEGPTRYDSVRAATWSADSAVKVVGSVDVGTGSVRGPLSVGGDLVADVFSVDSDTEVAGSVRVARALRIRGETRVGGALSSGDLDGQGRLAVGGPIRATGGVRLVGRFEGRGDLTVDGTLFIDGTIELAGTIRAQRVEVHLRGPSRAEAILAGSVVVRGPRRAAPDRFDLLRVEGSEVCLEDVHVEYVRAGRVDLGRNTRAVRVDGSVAGQHRTARVGPVAPFEVPPGLFR